MALPPLREELALLQGPRLADGQPSWTLHDPTRNRFFSLDWSTVEILSRWSLDSAEAIVSSVGIDTTLHLETDDVEQVGRFLAENQLLQPAAHSARRFADQLAHLQGGRFKWLLHHYLFFRIPLLKPDAWLQRWQPVASLFYSRTFAVMTLLAVLIGVFEVLRHWEVFSSSLVDTFNWNSLAAYGAAVFVVKLLHELGHAFTARRFGCRIPSMGVAFLVLWPMAYTDTNEAWRLKSRSQRLKVGAAGIIVEMVVAAWSTLAWALLPDGALRTAAFVLATTSWITTLAINTSPFMRFDGYFIVSDWLEIPNLHERSFALARWKLREYLFDLGEAPPEYFRPARERMLILFAWAVWAYRLVVFLGIAILVYHFFIKVIGILLFMVEIVWFVALPIRAELQAWRQRWPSICRSRRSRISAGVAIAVLIATFLPWPGRVTTSGILRPAEVWPVFAPGPSQVVRLPFREGDQVSAGDEIVSLAAPDLQARRATAAARVERIRWQAASAGFNSESRNRLQSAQDELATAEAELAGIDEELVRYAPKAPFAGQLRDIDPDLRPGQWLARQERIAMLVGAKTQTIETYIDDESVKRISVGDRGVFTVDSAGCPPLKVTVKNIDVDAAHVLTNRMLAAPLGGNILVRERKKLYIPEHAVYRVSLAADEPRSSCEDHSWRGTVVIRARWEAPAARYLRNTVSVLLREAGF
jgi:putative peptide zinc metalloprotease protein